MPLAKLLDPERITLTKAASLLGVHVSTVHRWRSPGVRGHKLRCVRLGGKTFVTPAELERFIAALSDPAPATEAAADLAGRAAFAGEQLAALGL